jgi:hypothetical protein
LFVFSALIISVKWDFHLLGNRSTHYRDYKGGVTLVHFLSSIPVALAKFKEQVEEAMPGMYDWFSEESLHVTLRALL